MTPTLTPEQIGELEALLAKATPAPWDRDTENGRREETFEMLIDSNGKVLADTANSDLQVIDYDSDEDGTRYFDETGYRNFSAIAALRNAAPALIAMAKRVITHDSPAWDANERLNATVEDLIERAEKAEAEVATLLTRLKSTESALDRAMARSNSWREEAAKLQAAELAAKNGVEKFRKMAAVLARCSFDAALSLDPAGDTKWYSAYVTSVFREPSITDLLKIEPLVMQPCPPEKGAELDAVLDRVLSVAEAPRTCDTCAHQEMICRIERHHPCAGCTPISLWPNWTPKPIPRTTDKGEKP